MLDHTTDTGTKRPTSTETRRVGPRPRHLLAFVAVLVAVLVVAAPATAWAPTVHAGSGDAAIEAVENSSAGADSNAPAGAHLSGSLSAEGAALGGSLDARTVDIRLARAETADAKAATVATLAEAVDARLTTLEARRAALQHAHAEGDVAPGAYQHRLADLTADSVVVDHLAGRLVAEATTIPEATRQAHGVDLDALRALASRTTAFEEDVRPTPTTNESDPFKDWLNQTAPGTNETTSGIQQNGSESVSAELAAALSAASTDLSALELLAASNLTAPQAGCLNTHVPTASSTLTAAYEAATLGNETRATELLGAARTAASAGWDCVD